MMFIYGIEWNIFDNYNFFMIFRKDCSELFFWILIKF